MCVRYVYIYKQDRRHHVPSDTDVLLNVYIHADVYGLYVFLYENKSTYKQCWESEWEIWRKFIIFYCVLCHWILLFIRSILIIFICMLFLLLLALAPFSQIMKSTHCTHRNKKLCNMQRKGSFLTFCRNNNMNNGISTEPEWCWWRRKRNKINIFFFVCSQSHSKSTDEASMIFNKLHTVFFLSLAYCTHSPNKQTEKEHTQTNIMRLAHKYSFPPFQNIA